MNDFTKKELEMILRAVKYWLGENAGGIIKDKLQSLIDNYCDHQFVLKGKGVEIYAQCSKCDYRLFKNE